MEPEDDDAYWDFPDYDLWSKALDVASYNTLIAGSDWEGAIRLLGEMRKEGVTPNEASYNAALRACSRAARGQEACELLDEMWQKGLDPDASSYSTAIGACRQAGDHERAGKLLDEFRMWGPAPHVERFHVTPKLDWNRVLRRAGCGLRNLMAWNGRTPPPPPPQGPSCWLLPSQEESALAIAECQAELREAGWKVLSSPPAIVARLGNKVRFRELAASLGLEPMLPVHYDDREAACFPCVLKPATGTWGKDSHIVRDAEEARLRAPASLGTRWVLQELIVGRLEYSTTLLCNHGEVLDAVCTRYEYDKEEYVWPHNVKEVRHEECSIPASHLSVMRAFLGGFSGICNFNYKLRQGGEMCIFEVNPRIGGDLAFDVPRPRARALFEKLDALFS